MNFPCIDVNSSVPVLSIPSTVYMCSTQLREAPGLHGPSAHPILPREGHRGEDGHCADLALQREFHHAHDGGAVRLQKYTHVGLYPYTREIRLARWLGLHCNSSSAHIVLTPHFCCWYVCSFVAAFHLSTAQLRALGVLSHLPHAVALPNVRSGRPIECVAMPGVV
jgi:hypothetical protein